MKKSGFVISSMITVPVFMAILFALPMLSFAGGASEWTRMKQACERSGGSASYYNAFTTQGCICGGKPSHQRTCSGGSSSSAGAGQPLRNIVVNELIKGVFAKPQDNSAMRAEEEARAEEKRRKAAEDEARAAEQKRLADEESSNRLLGKQSATDSSSLSLMGVDSSSDQSSLSLMGVDSSSELKLMTDTQEPASSRSKANAESGPVYNQGVNDAEQCTSPNALSRCIQYAGKEYDSCKKMYDNGYAYGAHVLDMKFQNVYESGVNDAKAGQDNKSFNHPDTQGPCRIKLVQSYNRGYFDGRVNK